MTADPTGIGKKPAMPGSVILIALVTMYAALMTAALLAAKEVNPVVAKTAFVRWFGVVVLLVGLVIEASNVYWIMRGRSMILLMAPLCFGFFVLFSPPICVLLGVSESSDFGAKAAEAAALWAVSVSSLLVLKVLEDPKTPKTED